MAKTTTKTKTKTKTTAKIKTNDLAIRGAKEHNLKNLDLNIPRDKLVVITGPSGSGKSSLAFDTIYAEGQRRYVESLSTYARQFLDQNHKPDVELIEGLSPAISIEQKTTSKNPRSTVGTLTEIQDYLRLLFARVGKAHCPKCNKPVFSQTVQEIVDTLMATPKGTRFVVMAPIVRGRKGEHKKLLQSLMKEGFARIRIDGDFYAFASDDIQIDPKRAHTIDLVIDRLVASESITSRLTEAVELALKKGDGLLRIAVLEPQKETLYSEHSACPDCNISLPKLSPRSFSFNSPFGACALCNGLGHTMDLDRHKVIPDPNLSIEEGAIKPWAGRWSTYHLALLTCVLKHFKKKANVPWKKLSPKIQNALLQGTGDVDIAFKYVSDGHSFSYTKPFEGVIPHIQRRLRENPSDRQREEASQFMSHALCTSCHGARLRPESLAVTVGGQSLQAITALSIADLDAFFDKRKVEPHELKISQRILKEIRDRLGFLISVGLAYLSLDRSAGTLSGGEAQRIRLATQIGSALRGVIYVLDEPSIGLHQRDNHRLLHTLQKLRDLGNSVLVVEHDEDTIRAADHIIDMGPGAGVHGGYVVVAGDADTVIQDPKSLTGAYLSGRKEIACSDSRRAGHGHAITLTGASGNNLKSIDAAFPLGTLICVTGVSGSGKSTLINETLRPALGNHLSKQHTATPAPYDKLCGAEHIDRVIEIDQSAIGRTPRSNPATYTQLFSIIRDLFAQTHEARARGYKPGRFSFNVKGGRCERCQGDGILRIEMHFLPDIEVPCEICAGSRYNRETLEITYKERNIAQVLEMPIEEAATFFAAIPSIKKKLDTLLGVGLGYLCLGQSATTLSGGEAQRIKLAKELSKRATGKTFYILDEPTTGLHFDDVAKLLEVLHRLVEGGNTVVVIEHHLDVIKTADHIIDLGPEGGDQGGEILAIGTPEEISKMTASHTGRFLKPLLRRNKKAKSA